MPRRRVLTEAQLENLLALPTTETDLVRYWTLGDEDLAIIGRRRRAHNRLGFALQLCALRYPGRVLCAGEVLPDAALSFVAEQIGTEPDVLADYGARVQTRYQQLDALRAQFGFGDLAPVRQEILGWLLPVALTTTSAASIAEALCDELRRRRLIVPAPSVIEELVAAARTTAECHVARQLTNRLSPAQVAALDGLLSAEAGTSTSVLAWARSRRVRPGIGRWLAWSGSSSAYGRSASTRRAPMASIRSASVSSRARAAVSRRSTCGPSRRPGAAPRSSPPCSTRSGA